MCKKLEKLLWQVLACSIYCIWCCFE